MDDGVRYTRPPGRPPDAPGALALLGAPVKLVRTLANLGYGSRKQVLGLLRAGRVLDATGTPCGPKDTDDGGDYTVDGQALDPRTPVLVALHKPCGLETTRKGAGPTVYDALPPRFLARSPSLSPVGRLDKDTSGLLLFTDDGTLLHRLTHPRHHVAKVYRFEVARPIDPSAVALFASGALVLESDAEPLKPAELSLDGPLHGTLTIREGRYHQIRRMLAAVGTHVVALHRTEVGPLSLGDLAEGQWRYVTGADRTALHTAVGLPSPA